MSDQHYSQAAQQTSELTAQAAAATAQTTQYLIELLKYFAVRFQPEKERELHLVSSSANRQKPEGNQPAEEEQQYEIKIRVGAKNVLVGRLGEKPSRDLVDEKTLERITTAIANPAESKGVVSVLLNGEVVYRVRNGVVDVEDIDRGRLQAAIAAIFNDVELERAEGAELGQSMAATQPKASPPVAKDMTVPEIRSLIHSELVTVKAELDRVNARLADLERKIETGELVPATQIAARYLDSLPKEHINRGVNGLSNSLHAATSEIQNMRSQSGAVRQERQESLTNRFSKRVTRPFRRAREAIRTNGAATTLKNLGSRGLEMAAIQDIVQKANVLLKVEGTTRDGAISFADSNFRINKDNSSLEIVRRSNNSTVLKVSDGAVVENTLTLRDMASMGISSLEAVQQHVTARRRAEAMQQKTQARPTGRSVAQGPVPSRRR